MKTTRFTILCLCVLLGMSILGCGQKVVTTIKGTVANDSIAALPGVVVELIDANTDEVVDSSALKGGKFTLEVASTLEKLYVVQLVYPGSNPRGNAYRTIVIPDISKVLVTLSESSVATGSPVTSSYVEFTDKFREMLAGNDIARIAELCRETYESNLNNLLGVQALGLLTQFDDNLKLEELEELFNKGGDCVKNNEQLKSTLEDLRNAAETETGNPYKEIEGNLADGTPAKLSDYVGKGYVLVDFWASWCGPCMASVPELKELYAELTRKASKSSGSMYGSRMLKPAPPAPRKGDELADSVHPGSSGQRLRQPAQCRDRHLRRTRHPDHAPDRPRRGDPRALYRYSEQFQGSRDGILQPIGRFPTIDKEGRFLRR